jgi:RNA polymerase sigma-70 factor, ECF subfamily
LFRRHSDRVWRCAYLVTGSRTLADDATQDGFVAAYAALDRFDRGRAFGPWVGRIVVNRALNLVRAEQRHTARMATLSAPPDWVEEDQGVDPSIREALAALDPGQRAVVALRFWLDLTGPEIANALELPLGTVRSRLSRALDTLRTTMEGST